MHAYIKFGFILILSLSLQGCLGAIVGTTADVVIEVIKVPFKVGGAAVDVVTGDDLTDRSDRDKNSQPINDMVYKVESKGL